MSESPPWPLRNGAFLRSTVFVMMGPLSPPAKYWESPALCKALPWHRAAEAAVQPLGALGWGWLGSMGEALRQRLPQRSVDARNLGICWQLHVRTA